jgi:hypothetical protein
MAPRRKLKQREARLAFEALTIEGGLLSPDWLSRIAQLSAGNQAEADYRVPKGLNLRDEIGRYWRVAQAHWSDFAAGRTGGADMRVVAERFVTALLRESFGFASIAPSKSAQEVEGRSYPIGFFALGRRVPVVIAPAGVGLDEPATEFGDDGRRRTAFGLCQEYLNAEPASLWGLVCDGSTLRILRDNASLTRPAWIEASLERIFTEERYADFAALWLLVHESRFGRPDQPVAECALEMWRSAGREEGTRAREHLRSGVEEALVVLGHGFLAYPENQALRAALHDGTLSTKDYFNQLLRFVYRLIFVITAEERGVLHPDGASEAVRKLYAEGYGLRRLRERSTRRSAHDRFSDLWDSVRIVFRGMAKGQAKLGLPALAGLFAEYQCRDLDAARLENRALLAAMFKLCWLKEDSGLARVNWRDMGPEELGSVYEGLLELVPVIKQGGHGFEFATGGETKGNARKTTGSYYTPDSLVQVLLDSALDPVVKETIAKNPENPVEALLGLFIVDPACGSGHFLLAAARRLAVQVARLTANGTPSAAEYRHALRQVVGRCIFGVDLNPMAVELCRVSLWMEAVEPGRPLTFLDSHIQQGNSLIGTTPELMANGIPDAAWEPIEGDDKKIASALKKRNKAAAKGQRDMATLWSKPAQAEAETVAQKVAKLDAASDASVEELASKQAWWDEILRSAEFHHQKFIADSWCAAFVWPKKTEADAAAAPTNDVWRQIRDGQGHPPQLTRQTTEDLARQYSFFHWHLAFPQVFGRGGFDVVLGNPPWDQKEVKELEWFAQRAPHIAKETNTSKRKALIERLREESPRLFRDFVCEIRSADASNHIVRESGRFPLCAVGRMNTYALFAEANWNLLGSAGRAGFIVPTGIATDDGTSAYFRHIIASQALQQIVSFENEGTTFSGVNNRQSFCLLSLTRVPVSESKLTFNVNQPLPEGAGELAFTLAADDFHLFNPNTGNCPTFRTARDATINRRMYKCAGVLWRESPKEINPWGLSFMQGLFNMSSDSGLFRSRTELETLGLRLSGNRFEGSAGSYLPLVEAKMLAAYDHRFGTYEGATQAHFNKGFLPRMTDEQHANPSAFSMPNDWVAKTEVERILEGRWTRAWLLGWRDISPRTNARTVIASLIPRVAVGHTMPLLFSAADPSLLAGLYANLSSFALDYAGRQKVGGTHVTYSYLKQFPVLPPATYEAVPAWCGTRARDWLLPRVLELTYTAWDLEPFAKDVGYEGPPFRWDPERRFLLRAELDAAFFHLYGISRDDTAYVMDTFPIVRRNDEKAHSEYRTKRVILEIYGAMAEAARTGKPYQTRLDPPPADSREAHPDDRPKKPGKKRAVS